MVPLSSPPSYPNEGLREHKERQEILLTLHRQLLVVRVYSIYATYYEGSMSVTRIKINVIQLVCVHLNVLVH